MINDLDSTINTRIILIDDNDSIHQDFQKAMKYDSDHDDNELADIERVLFGKDSTKETKAAPISAGQNQNLDFTISYAHQGEEGYKKIIDAYKKGQPYAVAFIDIRMPPGWDGIETAKKILQEEPYIQIVLCSAHSDYTWTNISSILNDSRRWMILKKPYDIIEVKQIATAFSIKWSLERQQDLEIRKRTKSLELLNEQLKDKIEDLTAAREEINHMAYYDELTSLPNRRFFVELLEYSIAGLGRSDSKLGLLYVDLDNFKRVNDSLGHTKGDILLKKFVERLSKSVRAEDVMGRMRQDAVKNNDRHLARLAGDEFVILIQSLKNFDQLNNISARIHHSMTEPFIIDGTELDVTCSIGIATYPDDAVDGETLLVNADMAMYSAKTTGKAHTKFFDKDYNLFLQSQIALERKLRQAYNDHEYEVYYQPITDIPGDKIIGFEALLRWNSKDGIINPDSFIEVMEYSNLIVDIGNWVLEQACFQCKKWQQEFNSDYYICVNISRQQLLLSGKFLDTLQSVLNRSGLKPEYLHIEVTERILVYDDTKLLNILHQLKKLGVKISIDDFGTGYTSLRYLNELPIDTIKFDKYYISNLSTDVSCQKIVDSMLSLCQKLSMNVVAEGIENKEEMDYLKTINCDAGQGYYLHYPMQSDDITKVLDKK